MKRFGSLFQSISKYLFAYLPAITLVTAGLFIGLLTPSSVFAQDPSAQSTENYVDNDYAKALEAATDPNGNQEMNAPAFRSMMDVAGMSNIIRIILGPIPGVTVTADAFQRNPEYVKHMAQGSAVLSVGNYIAAIYDNPPASTSLFIADIGRTLGFMPQAYAQGIGFSGLSPLLPIWKAFRNIAYLLLAIVMMTIGFMVMFRKKIDPKTVVTVQNAIPRIVITLLLITFSYAIVGIMIDLMYLSILIIVGIFGQSGLVKVTPEVSNAFMGEKLKSAFDIAFPNGVGLIPHVGTLARVAYEIVGGPAIPGAIAGISAIAGIFIVAATSGLGLTLLPLVITGTTLGVTVAAVVVILLLAIFLFFAYVRLFFTLFGCYIQILLSVILGPLQLLFEAFPGTNSFSEWLKNLLANLMAFPITVTVFLLIYMFINIVFDPTKSQKLWAPPLLMGAGASSDTVVGLISLGLLLMAPSLINQVKDAIKAKPVLPVGASVAQALSSPLSTGMQALSIAYYIKNLKSQPFVQAPKQAQPPQPKHGAE